MPSNLHVLHYTDTLTAGGKERQLVELLKGLSGKERMRASLVTMSDVIHYTDLEPLNIETHTLLRKSKHDPGILLQFYKLCKQCRPDIIHTWNSMCSVYALPTVILQRITLVNGDLRDAPAQANYSNKDWRRLRLTAPFAGAVLANSKAGLHAYGVGTRKGYVIHNGFDLQRIQDLEDEQKIKDKFHVGSENIVGMVASFSSKKDYATLIQAALRILALRKDVTFVTVGDGVHLDTCKKMVPKSLRDKILFLGRQEKQVESIINIFTIGVLATFTEGISNSIMEYMALGKPVVATDCEGNREIVLNNETGLLATPKDPVDLADKIAMLLDSPEKAQRFGVNGRDRIKQDFNLEKMTSNMIQLYQKILRNEN